MKAILLCVSICLVAPALAVFSGSREYNVHWGAAGEFGTNQANQPTYFSGMPLGNGDLVALAWPNMTAGGVQMYVRKADAMSSQAELFTLASVQAGGSDRASRQIEFSVYVDANSNHVLVNVSSPVGNQFSVTVNIDSVRPATPITYSVPFVCEKGISQPDVFVDPIPSGLPKDCVVIYHRNDPDADGSTVKSTLQQQGLEDIIPEVPDWWSNLQFGILAAGNIETSTGPSPLERSSPKQLSSSSATGSFASVQISALTSITAAPSDWIQHIGSMPSPSPRSAHEQWWTSFWDRSYINVSCSAQSETAAPAPEVLDVQHPNTASHTTQRSIDSPPVSNPLVWLDASQLSLQDGEPLYAWPDLSGNRYHAFQSDSANRPTYFSHAGLGSKPVVRFDGKQSSLLNHNATISAEKTIIALFRDMGSTGTCCNPVIYFPGANADGLSTISLGGDNADDDAGVSPIVTIKIDYGGSGDQGILNIDNRTVVGVVQFTSQSSSSSVNGCTQSSGIAGSAGTGYEMGSRTFDGHGEGRYFLGDISEVLVYSRALSPVELDLTKTYLMSKWATSQLQCQALNPCAVINRQQVLTRYVQTIQSLTMWPIKFNGMLFQAALPPNADYRDWGPSNWWQNTRLSYGSMLQTGDEDVFQTILKYYNNTLPFATRRTQAYFNHSGIFYTETKHILGAYASEDYGCSRPQGWPTWLETNDYIKNDYGGDGGTPEVAMQVLDHYMYTLDEEILTSYLPIATSAIDFFMQHYPNRTDEGKLVIWPTQALETYWCAGWDVKNNRPPENCCVDDLPTIAGIKMLVQKLLQLPEKFTTPAQRAAWQQFSTIVPDLPLSSDGSTYLSARILSSGVHNSETPELYCVHPYRLVTLGRNLTQGVSLTPAINAFLHDGNAHSNEGWNQGIINAALLGLTDTAVSMLKQRAATGPAPGYRFPGFMPHFQDYEPSSNHLANYLTALNFMLLQPADDDLSSGKMVLFGAWPCDWSVSFKLHGPLNTIVEVVYTGGSPKGTLESVIVTPSDRKSALIFANCV